MKKKKIWGKDLEIPKPDERRSDKLLDVATSNVVEDKNLEKGGKLTGSMQKLDG